MTDDDVLQPVVVTTYRRPRHVGRHARPKPQAEHSILGQVAFVISVGVLLVAFGFDRGRSGRPWGQELYWLGEILTFAPLVAVLILRRELKHSEAIGSVVAFAVATYVIKVCYSPLRLEFPDELQHMRGTFAVLTSGHLFQPNPSLPISSQYPGLAAATSGLVLLTGLSVTVAALVLMGAAHLLTVVAIFLLLEETLGSHRLAAIGTMVYATGPHFQVFDSLFIYQTLALPFCVLTLYAAKRLVDVPTRGRRAAWFSLAVLTGAVTVVTHHVTSYAMLGLLLCMAAAALWLRRWRDAAYLGALTATVLAMISLWVGLVAPQTLSYLAPLWSDISEGVRHLLKSSPTATTGAAPQTGSISDRFFSYAAVLLTLLALAIGWWDQRSRRWQVLPLAMAVASVSFVAIVAVRVAVPDGAELAGRAYTFSLIPVAAVLAVAADRYRRRRHIPGVAYVAPLGMIIVFIGGLTAGWPPAWERLPGKYIVSGFESSISPQGVAAADWAASRLGANNRVGSDTGNLGLISTIGLQVPVRNDAALFYDPRWTAADTKTVEQTSTGYLLVDTRLSNQIPPTGAYFPVDPEANRIKTPIPLANLEKFAGVPGISRVYDNGAISIYSLGAPR